MSERVSGFGHSLCL